MNTSSQPSASDGNVNDSYTFYGPLEMAMDNSNDKAPLEAPEIKMTLSILLCIIMTMSIIGNLVTCIIIIRDRTMRTPTNFYLFNLAVADFLISLFIPLELYIIWMPDNYPLGEIGCRTHQLLFNCLSNATLLIITIFTIERYLVVSRPFLRQTLSKCSRVSKILAGVWFVSLSFAIPEAINVDVLVRKKDVYCYTRLSFNLKILTAFQLTLCCLLPLVLVTFIYILMAIKLRSKLKRRRGPVNGKQNREKAIRMLVAITACFFICCAPLMVMRLMMLIPELNDELNTWRVINYLSLLNGYLATSVNPILYGLMSGKFRRAFKEIFTQVPIAVQMTISTKMTEVATEIHSCHGGEGWPEP